MGAIDVPHRVMDDVLDIDVSAFDSREDVSPDGVPTLVDLWHDPTLEGPFRTPCGGWYGNLRFDGVHGENQHLHLMQAYSVGPTQRLTRNGHQMFMIVGPNGEIERLRS